MSSRSLSLTAMFAAACSSCECRPAQVEIDAAVPRNDKVVVPAGWFTAGCITQPADPDPSSDPEELSWRESLCIRDNPPRRVWLSSYAIDRYEVTRAEYRVCFVAGACKGPLVEYSPEEPSEPAIVAFADAEAYCRWRGDRLPTVAEWEKAARGIEDDRMFPWGDHPPTCVHAARTDETDRSGDEEDFRCPEVGPVGIHPAGRSPYGVEDLHGNSGEWTASWYPERAKVEPRREPRVRRVERGGRTVVVASWTETRYRVPDPDVIDPQGPPGPTGNEGHVAKGVTHGDGHIGATMPGFDHFSDSTEGFRCVRSVAGPPPPDVPQPVAGEFALPYREPGFEPEP